MNYTTFIESLICYKTGIFIIPEENQSLETIIRFAENNPGCFEREHPGHITGSAWIVNHDYSKVLLTHHKKLNIWLQLGGHADGNPHMEQVALREAQEESGIAGLQLLNGQIFDVDVHHIPGKCITHYDIRYLLCAPIHSQYKVSPESHDLAWVSLDEISSYSQERSIIRMTEKIQAFTM